MNSVHKWLEKFTKDTDASHKPITLPQPNFSDLHGGLSGVCMSPCKSKCADQVHISWPDADDLLSNALEFDNEVEGPWPLGRRAAL